MKGWVCLSFAFHGSAILSGGAGRRNAHVGNLSTTLGEELPKRVPEFHLRWTQRSTSGAITIRRFFTILCAEEFRFDL